MANTAHTTPTPVNPQTPAAAPTPANPTAAALACAARYHARAWRAAVARGGRRF